MTNKVDHYFVTSLKCILLLNKRHKASPNSFAMNRKHLLLVFILLISCQAALAQTSYRVIGTVHQIEEAMSSNFYISEVKDQRAFTANLGIVNRGEDQEEKRALIPKVGFWEDVKMRMNSWTNPAPQSSPVTVQVEELYLWENRSKQSDEGHVQLKVRFVEQYGQEVPVETELLGAKSCWSARGMRHV